MADFDSPWKEALDLYFQAFLAFFFPRIHDDIDWSRGFESLDKELQKIAPQFTMAPLVRLSCRPLAARACVPKRDG